MRRGMARYGIVPYVAVRRVDSHLMRADEESDIRFAKSQWSTAMVG